MHSDLVFETLVSRIRSESGETIASRRLAALIRDTTGKTGKSGYRGCIRRLLRLGHLETLSQTGVHAYLIRKQESSDVSRQEGVPAEVIPAVLPAPGIQRIRAAAEQLAIAVEDFRQRTPESGIMEVLKIPNDDLKVLAKLLKDAADYTRGFVDDVNHLVKIADQLRENRGFGVVDNAPPDR